MCGVVGEGNVKSSAARLIRGVKYLVSGNSHNCGDQLDPGIKRLGLG